MVKSSQTVAAAAVPLLIAPALVLQGNGILGQTAEITRFGQRPLVVGGDRSFEIVHEPLQALAKNHSLTLTQASYHPDCSETSLERLRGAVVSHQADFIIGIGGGKALDAAKLLAEQCQLRIVTIPTSAATCAAWSALSNVYSDRGAFAYDVALARCPDLLILDYDLIKTAPQRTLVAGIGDAIAKWYEASVSSGSSTATLTVAALQQARVLRDLLLQNAQSALQDPGGPVWREVVDATILLAGAIGGLGGAACRTVAAHAVHNGLTQIGREPKTLHGEKVAYGILVQLRLEELVAGNQLALSARQQLLQFYEEIGLPSTLEALGLGEVALSELRRAALFACRADSDIHRLPFPVVPEQLLAAMVSTAEQKVSKEGRV